MNDQHSELTLDQEATLQLLNDRWGVDSWDLQPDGTLLVTLDDGDHVEVTAMGNWEIV